MSWLILAFAVPIFVVWKDGSSYAFAVSLMVVGSALYSINIFLIRYFIARREPSTLADGTWEKTAGKGIVPRWVSVLGLVGIGLAPSGLMVAVLLFFSLITNRGG